MTAAMEARDEPDAKTGERQVSLLLDDYDICEGMKLMTPSFALELLTCGG